MLRRVLVLSLFATTLAGAAFFERGPDPVIFGDQTIPIYFTHNYHVRKPDEAKGVTGEGLSCTFCHENIEDSAKSSDLDIPGHDSCDTCHAEWIGEEDEPAPVAECARCHTDLDPKLTRTSTVVQRLIVPNPNIIFPHSAHTSAEIECVECHASVTTKAVAGRDDYPTMDRCIECHSDRDVSVECKTCHITDVSGRIVTQYATGELKPRRYHLAANHEGNFLRQHAVAAKRNEALCNECHTKNDCLSCHDGIGRDVRYHPGDWIAVHRVGARQDNVRCESCHRVQTFCLNCHIRSGVALATVSSTPMQRTADRGGFRPPRTPHPMGAEWIGTGGALGRNFHGFHAQRNIRACASCHQEQFCITCHAATPGATPFGGNPHGPNPQRLRGSTASKRNARACLKCHDPADPSWR